jgi:hypothetical protein
MAETPPTPGAQSKLASSPNPSRPAGRRLSPVTVAVGAVITLIIVAIVLATTLSSPGSRTDPRLQSWAHNAVDVYPSPLLLLRSDISMTSQTPSTGESTNFSAICQQGVTEVQALQRGPFPPIANVRATYTKYLNAAGTMYRSCVTSYHELLSAAAVNSSLLTQSQHVVQLSNQLDAAVQALGGSLAAPSIP